MLDLVDEVRRSTNDVQKEILLYAESEGKELSEALEHFGLNYDDLVYENQNLKHWCGEAPLSLSSFHSVPNGIPFVSFFSGCGGMDLGFENAGFKHVAAFEINELFCKTLRRNRPAWQVFGPPLYSGDVSRFSETVGLLEQLVEPNFDGIFLGGPPCQPFSIAANQRFSKSGGNYKRTGFANAVNGSLLFHFVKLIKHFRPSCFVIENVPGLRDLDGGRQISLLSESLIDLGYSVQDPYILNAADYGVPQFRERLFLVGTRNGSHFALPQKAKARVGCGSVLHREKGVATNNETRAHKLESVRRYIKLDYGERDPLGRVDRLDPTIPAKVVIAGGTKGGGRSHLHPDIPRTLSVRECARLQSFPDDYVFVGPTGRQFTQVGNAVPPALASQLAAAIATSVFGVEEVSCETE